MINKQQTIFEIILIILVFFCIKAVYWISHIQYTPKDNKVMQMMSMDDVLSKANEVYEDIFTQDGYLLKTTNECEVENEFTTDDLEKIYDKSFLEILFTKGELTFEDVDKKIEQKKLIMSNNHLATTNIIQALLLKLQKSKELSYIRSGEDMIEVKRFQVPAWYVLNSTPSANFYGKCARIKGSPTLNELKFKNWDLYNQKYKNITEMANFVKREWNKEEGGEEANQKWINECKKRNVKCEVMGDDVKISSNVFVIHEKTYNNIILIYQHSFKTNDGNTSDQSTFKYFANAYNIDKKQWLFENQDLLPFVLSFIDFDNILENLK